jgi:hypothetical protein
MRQKNIVTNHSITNRSHKYREEVLRNAQKTLMCISQSGGTRRQPEEAMTRQGFLGS